MEERKNKRHVVIIKSLLWNSIISVFKEEKNIDITSYLISIQINGDIIFLKTNNPLIKSELLLIDDKIKKLFSEKLKKVGIKLFDFELKYI
ncbi:MAG: hypothetical protein GY828_00455 [Candidatus Gracilibacteria bacterium]|nr:hypothetical protein [Candidatus Gracilibacteria bacterium]